MATLSTICFQKFIKDLKAGRCPESLDNQYQKLAIDANYCGKKKEEYYTIQKFRQFFSISDVTKIISFYKAKQAKQIKLDL